MSSKQYFEGRIKIETLRECNFYWFVYRFSKKLKFITFGNENQMLFSNGPKKWPPFAINIVKK